jgi:hypothetical protein
MILLRKKPLIITNTDIKLLFIFLKALKNMNKNLILYTIIVILLETEFFKVELFKLLLNYTNIVRKNGIYTMI